MPPVNIGGAQVKANRWTILGALCVVRLGIGFQFQTVGSVAPFLVDDLGIDYSQIGTLVGLFMLPGIVLALPAGFLGKLYGDKRVSSLATAGWWSAVSFVLLPRATKCCSLVACSVAREQQSSLSC